MIDIHTHVLPMVDDGSRSLQETKKIFGNMAELGYTSIVATPHWAVGMPAIPEAVIEQTRAAAWECGVSLSVARECRIHPSLADSVANNPHLRVDGGPVVLVELPWGAVPEYAPGVFRSLVNNGFRPVLVHPERHGELFGDERMLDAILRTGAVAQINLQSLAGAHGKNSKSRALLMLENRAVALVATDIHAASELDDSIPSSLNILERLVGASTASILTGYNPDALLTHRAMVDFRHPEVAYSFDLNAIRETNVLSSLVQAPRRLFRRGK